MRNLTYILLGFFLTFIVTVDTYADSSVTSTTNVFTQSSSNTTSSCHTTVRINVNGQEQDITKDDCGNVDMENAGSSVHITNNANTNNNNVTPFPTTSPFFKTIPTIITPTIPPTPTIKIHKEQIKEFHKQLQQQKNFIDNLRAWMKNFFTSFHF